MTVDSPSARTSRLENWEASQQPPAGSNDPGSQDVKRSRSVTPPRSSGESEDEDEDFYFSDDDSTCSGHEEPSQPGKGTWTREEHKRFLEAIKIYVNGPWKLVAEYIGTRTVRQTMIHAQKYRQKAARRIRGLRTKQAIMGMHHGHEVSEESMVEEQLRMMLGQSRHAYLPPELVAQLDYSPSASPMGSPVMPGSPGLPRSPNSSPFMPSSPIGSPFMPSSPFSNVSGPIYSPRPILSPADIDGQIDDPGFQGFLSSATSGTLNIWNDQSLLDVRLSPDDIVAIDPLYKARTITEVWRGHYQSRLVAIKRFHLKQEDQAAATSLAHNVKAVATLTHPNIVSLIGMEWDCAPQLQVVTEYVEGGDLRTLLDSPLASDLTWTEFKCQVAIDIAAALDHLHTLVLRVPLRCLTSRKVLLDTNGRAKVNLLQTSGIENDHKLRWTAPEVILGGATTDRSDIYSFGVLLCELDTTHVPFHAVVNPNGSTMEDQQVAMLVASGKMVPSVSSTCPEGIARLASQCVSYDPSQRPVASAVTYRLREILKNEL